MSRGWTKARAWLGRLLLGATCCALMAQKPPSSLRRAGSLVHFSHQHERVASCRAAANAGGCNELRVKAGAGAELSCVPVRDELVSAPTEPRSPFVVSLPNTLGLSTSDSRLVAGTWRLSWLDQHATLRVPSGQQLQVRMRTVSGRCVRKEESCSLESSFARREIVAAGLTASD